MISKPYRLSPAALGLPCTCTRRFGYRLWTLLLVLIALWATAPAHAQPRDNDYYESIGTELLQAVEKFHLGPGEQEMREKRYDAAYRDLTFILNYFPNHPQALLLIGQTCETWKSYTCNAEEFFAHALARNPKAAQTHAIYGIYLLRIHKHAEAIQALNDSLALNPNSVNAHYNLGLAYLETGQYDLANEHAQKAYALGAPVSGLRDRLIRSGHWKPTEPGATGSTGTPALTGKDSAPAKP